MVRIKGVISHIWGSKTLPVALLTGTTLHAVDSIGVEPPLGDRPTPFVPDAVPVFAPEYGLASVHKTHLTIGIWSW